ncbi:MAG: hypothetical protein AAF721_07585 [Myxococcota bacterium]
MRVRWLVPTLCFSLAGCPGDDAAPNEMPVSTSAAATTMPPATGTTDGTGTTTGSDPGGTTSGTTAGPVTTVAPDTGTTAGTACADTSGSVSTTATAEDPHGHGPFLHIFNAGAMENVVYTVAGGNITVSIDARDEGSGTGHSGLTEVTGPIDANCNFDITGVVPFASDTGSFGDIDFAIAVTDGEASMSMSGGDIPTGPIDFTFPFAVE